MPRTAIACVWLGPWPAHLGLWLASCARNAEVMWILATDQPAPPALPANVRVVPITLADLRKRFTAAVGFRVSLDRPYKLCDFKPLYYLLVPDLDRYLFWGFCDLDVIWGRIAPFIASHAARYDRLLGEGHLSLFRCDGQSSTLFRQVDRPDWRATLSTPAIGGLDEHQGINRVWIESGRPLLFDNARVADIQPEFPHFRTLPRHAHDRIQAFAWRDGRILREYRSGGATCEQEYLYIHFQKRVMPVRVADDARDYFIGPAGFTPHPGRIPTRSELIAANPPGRPTLAGMRSQFRDWRRQRRADDPYRRIDRARDGMP